MRGEIAAGRQPREGSQSGHGAIGPRFSACDNTVVAMAKQAGCEPVLAKPAQFVRIVDSTAEDYTLIRP